MNGSIFSDLKSTFKYSTSFTKFIFINIAIFIVVNVVSLVFFLMQLDGSVMHDLLSWVAVPAGLSNLAIKPWTVFTYMFLHEDFFHLFFNMIILYWSGRIFTEYLGNKKFISTYIVGGICGAILYIAAYNLFPVFSSVTPLAINMGASAAVLAVLIGVATYIPDYSIFMIFIGPVRLKYIAIFCVVLDLLSIQKGNAGGHIAHLGGALYGFLFAGQLKNGRNISLWFDSSVTFATKLFSPKPKMKVSYRNTETAVSKNRMDHYSKQQTIDEILDKISKSGYDSLTKQEKDLLFNMSKNL